MNLEELIAMLNDFNIAMRPTEAINQVPSQAGLYAVFQNKQPVYIGKGSRMQRRLRNEFRGYGTFFRTIGLVWGYMPEEGSLIGYANQYNFKFNENNRAAIQEKIENELLVNVVIGECTHFEKDIINQLRPQYNLQHNPNADENIRALRNQAQMIARGET